jgi:mannitol-1-/sugar-/sorbitol-6-/2-deoxyglucose-6-phosphatase
VAAIDARALIFDMDGLLIDSEPLWWSVEKAFAAAHGVVWTDELAATCVGKGLPHVVETMQRDLGLEVPTREGVGDLIEAFIARRGELVVKPGARELLAAATVPCALATSNERRVAEAVLAELDLAGDFAAIVSANDVERTKPAPDLFLSAAERLGVATGAVVLEDAIAGVQAAIAAGMVVVAVPERDAASFSALTPHVVADLHAARRLFAF